MYTFSTVCTSSAPLNSVTIVFAFGLIVRRLDQQNALKRHLFVVFGVSNGHCVVATKSPVLQWALYAVWQLVTKSVERATSAFVQSVM